MTELTTLQLAILIFGLMFSFLFGIIFISFGSDYCKYKEFSKLLVDLGNGEYKVYVYAEVEGVKHTCWLIGSLNTIYNITHYNEYSALVNPENPMMMRDVVRLDKSLGVNNKVEYKIIKKVCL